MGVWDTVQGWLGGKKPDPAMLTEDIAGPTVTGLRPIIAGHPEEGLTPQKLAGMLREAELGNLIPAMWLAEAMEEKNLHYRAVLGTRRLQVSALPITVTEAGDDAMSRKAADLVREVVEGPAVTGALFDVLDAIGKGFSVSEIAWDMQGKDWRPERIEYRFPQWFEFDRVDGRTILMRGGPGDGPSSFQAPAAELARGNFGTPLPPYRFITHIHRSKSGLPIRGGLMRPAAWAYMFQNFSAKAWAIFLEVYGHPLRVGKYAFGATAEDKATLLRAVRSIAADAAAIIPAGMDIQFVEAGAATGTSPHMTQLDWWNAQLSKLVLGQTGTTDNGPYAGTAQTHQTVRDDIQADDAAQLAACLERDLVRAVVDLNLGPQARYPSLVMGEPDSEDLTALVNNVRTFVSMGGPVPAGWLADKLGIPAVEPGEPVLTAAPMGAQAPDSMDLAAQPPVNGVDGGELQPEPSPAGGILSAQAQQPARPLTDAMDAMMAESLSDWHPMMAPMIDPVKALADECSSLEEFQRRLPEAMAKQDPAKLAEALAKAAFASRLAGVTGAPVHAAAPQDLKNRAPARPAEPVDHERD
ncbi:MAG: DUF935 domain-containing protein [Magnetospirillum sp.]|nr:DUF935 domain-containing protein [Magnetospirillum sp.]